MQERRELSYKGEPLLTGPEPKALRKCESEYFRAGSIAQAFVRPVVARPICQGVPLLTGTDAGYRGRVCFTTDGEREVPDLRQ